MSECIPQDLTGTFWVSGLQESEGESGGKCRDTCHAVSVLNTRRERFEGPGLCSDVTSVDEVEGSLMTGTQGSPRPFGACTALLEFSAATSHVFKNGNGGGRGQGGLCGSVS